MVMLMSVALTAQVKPSAEGPGPQGATSSAPQTEAEPPDSPVPARSQASDGSQPPGGPESSAQPLQNGTEPVGTAAAPYEKPLGVAASRPAGAVMAPAKQRRTRTILIRVGLIAGAAAAIGIVVALSKSSPSRPN
jgi:hypothetical protein